MNKNFKIIKINGFKGIFFTFFVVGCLFSGFIIFPSWTLMHIWNFFGAYFPMMPVMQLIHGVVLWAIIALTIYASNKSNVAINFTSHNDADELQMREFITKIKPSGENIIEKEKVNK